MKKIYLIALLIIAAFLVPTGVFAKTYGGEFDASSKDPNSNPYTMVWVYDENSKSLVISGYGALRELNNENDQPWHEYSSQVENLIIEEGITSIGKREFIGMESLKSVSIPNTVNFISMRAFQDCTSLEEVTIPSNVGTIQDMAFIGCTSLKKVVFEQGVKKIGVYMFGDIPTLEDVYVYGENTDISRMRSNQDDGTWFRGMTDFSKLTVHCVKGSNADKYFTEDIYTITNWANDSSGEEATQKFEKKPNYMTDGKYKLNVEYISE